MTHWRKIERIEIFYRDIDEFLADMRAGTLKQGFVLDMSVWNGLVEMVNTDPKIAGEIMDNGVLLLMAVDSGFEIDGLMALAEVCCGRDRVTSDAG